MSKHTISTSLTVIALVGAISYVIATSPVHEKQIETITETYGDCVNKIAYDAYVNADVGDTFDAGFDVGLIAAKECSK